LWPIAIQFHAVAVRIAQVERLAHPVIGRALQPYARRNQPPQCIRQRRPIGINDSVMIEPGGAIGRRRAAQAFPCIQGNVMVITTGGEECSLVAYTLHQFKAKNVPVKSDSAFKISNLQVHVPHSYLRINRSHNYLSR
jgi:hypothetical protein